MSSEINSLQSWRRTRLVTKDRLRWRDTWWRGRSHRAKLSPLSSLQIKKELWWCWNVTRQRSSVSSSSTSLPSFVSTRVEWRPSWTSSSTKQTKAWSAKQNAIRKRAQKFPMLRITSSATSRETSSKNWSNLRPYLSAKPRCRLFKVVAWNNFRMATRKVSRAATTPPLSQKRRSVIQTRTV